jgi:hypothetical protein
MEVRADSIAWSDLVRAKWHLRRVTDDKIEADGFDSCREAEDWAREQGYTVVEP